MSPWARRATYGVLGAVVVVVGVVVLFARGLSDGTAAKAWADREESGWLSAFLVVVLAGLGSTFGEPSKREQKTFAPASERTESEAGGSGIGTASEAAAEGAALRAAAEAAAGSEVAEEFAALADSAFTPESAPGVVHARPE